MAKQLPPLVFVIPRVCRTWASSVSWNQSEPYAASRTHEAIIAGTHQVLVVTSWSRRPGRIFFTRPGTGHAPAARVVSTTQISATKVPTAAVAVVLPPQSCEPLLLGMCIYVCPDYETNDVEEGHPRVFGQELLGECQGDGRDNPADLHDWHEAGLDGGSHLVEGACASNDGHGHEVYRVLDG